MRARVVVVSLVAAASLGLAACGGDDDEELSRSDLSDKASEICKDASADSDKVEQPADLGADPVAAATYFEKVLPILEEQTERFEELKPDDEVKADWDQFLARQKQGTEVVKTLRDKARAKDRSGFADLEKLGRIGTKFDAEAKAVGADACADD